MDRFRQRILVIDDDSDDAEAIQLLSVIWGYEVDVANTVEGGFILTAARFPDAIVLDLALPTIEVGCSLVRRIRGLPRGDAIRIVALMGRPTEADRRQAIEAGCDIFLVKTVEPGELREALSVAAADGDNGSLRVVAGSNAAPRLAWRVLRNDLREGPTMAGKRELVQPTKTTAKPGYGDRGDRR